MGGLASLRLLLDECIQARIVEALTEDGHDVIRPPQVGTTKSPSDEAVLEVAVEEERILVTTDTDLCTLHTRWVEIGRSHFGIVVGQQDQNLKRFLRNLRYTLGRRGPNALRDQLVWIERAPPG